MNSRDRADDLRLRQNIAQDWLTHGVRAVFSDETEQYRTPFEPKPHDTVRVKIRTGKNSVDKVILVLGGQSILMKKAEEKGVFQYYDAVIEVGTKPVSYYFVLYIGKEIYFYNKLGVSRERKERGDFRILPGFSTAKWACGAIMYQIFVDRFYNGDPENGVLTGEYTYLGSHVVRVEDWEKPPAADGVREFYGGDLQGILDKLDYLQDLGVEVLYLNPVFVSPSNHKYDIQDYDYIDPHYGKLVYDEGELLRPGDHDNTHATRYINRVTNQQNLEAGNQLFIHLVEELHKRNMKILMDGVFNHCGSFHKWLDHEHIYENGQGYANGAYEKENSPYSNYFNFEKGSHWPDNESYEGWWGHKTLPKLNYEKSPALEEHILRIGKKWVSPPYNADGWRLDVAADLGHSLEYNHRFWKKFREAVKEANPDSIILAEHYGDCTDWLGGDEWDTVMNYDAFMEPVTWFLTGMEKHSDGYVSELEGNGQAFKEMLEYNMCSFTGYSLHCAMNELSNHDHSRFLTRTNHRVGRVAQLGSYAAEENVDKSIMQLAVLMQMTLPGAPTIYYGDEAGVCGFTDPDNRRTFPWGKEDWELVQFHKDLIRIHKKYKALKAGSMKILDCGKDYLAYGRFDENMQFVVAINRGDQERCVSVPVWELGVKTDGPVEMERIFTSQTKGHSVAKESVPVTGGMVELEIPPKTGILLRSK